MKIQLHCTSFVQYVKNSKYHQYPPFIDFIGWSLKEICFFFNIKPLKINIFANTDGSEFECVQNPKLIEQSNDWQFFFFWKSQNFSFPVCCHCWWHSCGVSQRSQQQTDDLFQHTIPTEKGSKQGLTKNSLISNKENIGHNQNIKNSHHHHLICKLKNVPRPNISRFPRGNHDTILSREATQTNKKQAKTEDKVSTNKNIEKRPNKRR